MRISSACPLRLSSILWQPRPGAFALTVICKATFALAPGYSPLAVVQEDPAQLDVTWEDGRAGSLRIATDLVPFKRRVDVLVAGHAHAPPGRPATSLIARVSLGEMAKAIEVRGDRCWTHGGSLTAPIPFSRMPLRWERAAAGPGAWNPAGIPPGAPPDEQGLTPVPNLLPIGAILQSAVEVIGPAGLGPIPPTWPERVTKLRRHAGEWSTRAWTDRPLPEDIDAAYFNAAPPDQQIDQLRAEDVLVLEHLHPEHPRLVTRLQPVSPRATAQRPGAAPQDVRLRCDTVTIDADRGICTLIWRGVLPLSHPSDEGLVLVTMETEEDDDDTAQTLVPKLDVTRVAPLGLQATPALPFVAPPAEWLAATAPTPPPPIAPDAEGTGTRAAGLVPMVANPLPFRPRSPADQIPAADDLVPHIAPAAPLGPLQPEPAPLPPAWLAAPPVEPEPPADEEPPRRPMPPPPPLLGAVVAPAEEAPARAESRTLRRISELPPAAPIAATPAEPPFDPAGVSLDEYAAVSAALAEGVASRAEVLRERGLEPPQWQAVERHWRGLIDAEVSRGGNQLRAQHDEAYVRAVEGFRGPVTLEEYAHIAIALERGRADGTLDELHIQRPALMPIVRLWTRKVASDPRLSGEAMDLLAALRAEG